MPQPRLTGASLTTDEPWIVTYAVPGARCSASVLTEHWLLTAAHCLEGLPKTTDRLLVSVADAASGPEEVYRGPARFHRHPDFGTFWDPSDDIALIQLVRLANAPPPDPPGGIPLGVTGRARLYAPFTAPLWAEADANRLFSIIGWGQGDVGGSGDCAAGTSLKKRFGTYFEVLVADRDARHLRTEFAITHDCPGNSGAPWLFARGGRRAAFAVNVGRSDFVVTSAKMHGAAIRPKLTWMFEVSSAFAPDGYLSCATAGMIGDLPYIECEEKALPDPEPLPLPCPSGQHCCVPGVGGDLCALCLPLSRECP